MFREEPIEVAAAKYARFPMRHTFEPKNPAGFAEFETILAGLSLEGATLTMLNLQRDRPTLWDMENELAEFEPPLLVLVGDDRQLPPMDLSETHMPLSSVLEIVPVRGEQERRGVSF